MPRYRQFTASFSADIAARGFADTNIHFETMEASIDNSPDKRDSLNKLLREKYADIDIEVIVTLGIPARDFLLNDAPGLFPQASIISTGSADTLRAPVPGRTVVEFAHEYDVRSTMQLARKLFPTARRCYVVVGSGPQDRQILPGVQAALAPFADTMAVAFSDGQTLEEILSTVAELPPDSVVLYVGVNTDSSGRSLMPLSVAREVARVSGVPVFGMSDALLEVGMLGGSVINRTEEGQKAAQFALDILYGKLGSSERLIVVPPMYQTMFDWRQLERWRIGPDTLPPGSLILNQPVTLWSQYKSVVIGGLAVIALLSAMVFSLIILNWRRKIAETASRQREMMLTGFLDAINESALLLDTTGVILYANKTVAQRFNASPDKLINYRMIEFLPAELRMNCQASLERAISSGVLQRYEDVRFGRNMDNIVNPITDSGEVRQLAVLALDVTERIHTRDQLSRSLASLEAQKIALQRALAWKTVITENSALLLLVTDRAAVIAEVSSGFCAATAYSVQELVGQGTDLLFPDAGASSNDRATYALLDSGKTVQAERRMRRKNGELFWVLGTASKMSFVGGPGEYIWIYVDITDRKLAEERENQILQADKMISMGVMASGIAHEINNPNNFININAPLLKDIWEGVVDVLDAHFTENPDYSVGMVPYSSIRGHVPKLIQGIIDGSSRIKNIVRDMKDFIRQKPGVFEDDLDMNAILTTALNLLSKKLAQNASEIRVRLGENLPKVRGVAQRLEQVVINLLINAAEALPDASRTIEVETSHDIERGLVLLSVRDHGKGIAPEDFPRIFDPFFTTKRETGGTGLGLSISRNIIKSHGGELVFDSRLGEGTTATMELKAAPDRTAQEKRP